MFYQIADDVIVIPHAQSQRTWSPPELPTMLLTLLRICPEQRHKQKGW